MNWTEGTILGDDIRLVAEVERGDGRVLWHARDGERGRAVAVERGLPVPSRRRGGEGLLAFHAAAEAASTLRHPGLLRVFDHGLTEDGHPYLIREPMPARHLARVVEGEGPLGLRRVGQLVEELLHLLEVVHPEGIACAGLTPDQVFLVGDEVKVWVQLVTWQPTAAALALGCVAPERTAGAVAEPDPCIALWEVGALAFFALTGRSPFGTATGSRFRAAVQGAAFPRIALRGDGGEASRIELDVWFRRALAFDPMARFQSAREMLDSWQSVVDGLLLFVDDDRSGAVAIVPAAGEEDADWLPTQVMDLPSILDDDDEDVTAISVRGAELEDAPSEPPVAEEQPPAAPADVAPLSTRTVHPITRTVPPSKAHASGLSPLMLVAGVAVAALSSVATTWLSQPAAPAARDCDCAAEVEAATTACGQAPTQAPATTATAESEAAPAPAAPPASATEAVAVEPRAPKELIWPAEKGGAAHEAAPAATRQPQEKPASPSPREQAAPDDDPYAE